MMKNKVTPMNQQRLIKISLTLFILSVAIAFIVIAKTILVPFVLATFLSYLLYPLVWKIEKFGINRGISIFMVLIVVIVVLGGATLLFIDKLTGVRIDVTGMQDGFEEKLILLQQFIENNTGLEAHTIEKNVKNLVLNLATSWQDELGGLFSSTTTILFQIAILPIFTFFLLLYRTKTAYFIFRICGKEKRMVTLTILREISTLTTKYLVGLLTVVAILAVLNSTGLFILGIKHALAFGVMAALLNLIPYIGTFIGGFIPSAYVFFTSPDPVEATLKVALYFTFVQFCDNNFITPNIVGSSIKINPLAIIVSLLFAGMIWGVPGMVVVVPVLATLKVIMRNVDHLKPYAYLISDRGMEKHTLKIPFIHKKVSKNKSAILPGSSEK